MPGYAAHRRAENPPSPSEEIHSILDRLRIQGRRSNLGKGSMISLNDGPHAGLHVLLRGRMKVTRFSEAGRVVILDVLGNGDVFGEMSLVGELDSEPTFAEALQPVEVETIPRFLFERVMAAHPQLAVAVVRLTGARRSRMEQRLGAQGFVRAPARLARLLLDLAERFGAAVPSAGTPWTGKLPPLVLDIPLSQQDLGNFIGASREIVNLTLSDFRHRGLISRLGRRIIVHPEKLGRARS